MTRKRKAREWMVHEVLLNRLLGVTPDLRKYGPLIRVKEVILPKRTRRKRK